MKNILVCMLVVVFMVTFSPFLTAGDKAINLFANAGLAVSDVEGLFVDVGAELQFTDNLYGQLLFDYYFNPYGEDFDNTSMYGINLYGVYKFQGSGAVNFFAKAGVHYTTQKYDFSILGFESSISESDFGVGGGLGIEYDLSEKMALVLGGTVKLIFVEGDTGTWFKLYGGINYQVN